MRTPRLLIACGALAFAACGNGTRGPEDTEEIDPYIPAMSLRINEVIYSRDSPARMLEELAALGVVTGKSFVDFKAESGIDDWFGEEWGFGGTRYTSMTCGLSPVVDAEGRITALFRNRRMVDGRLQPGMPLTPEG